MTKSIAFLFLSVFLTVIFISCGDLNNRVDEKLDELQQKAESLDSMINNEVDKVMVLDSIINKESDKVKKLDSLLNKSASRLDSIVNKIISPRNN